MQIGQNYTPKKYIKPFLTKEQKDKYYKMLNPKIKIETNAIFWVFGIVVLIKLITKFV